MSVIIKGMEMPRCCAECDAEGHYEDSYGDEYGFFCPFGYKAYTRETRELKRLDDCPLIHVPPHGRLIDADAMKKSVNQQIDFLRLLGGEFEEIANLFEEGIMKEIDNAPTIITEEESES